MKKRFLSILMALSLALSLLPTAAFADEGEEGVPCSGEAAQCTHVAEVGGLHYSSLSAAVAAVQGSGTVKLLKTVTEQDSITIDNGTQVVLDLNGNDITFKPANSIAVNNGALDVTGTGKISSSHDGSNNYRATIYAYGSGTDQANYSVVTIGENVTVGNQGSYGIAIMYATGTECAYGAKVVIAGTLTSTYGFSVNGMAKATSGNIPELTVTETGKVITEDGAAIYAAGYAKYDIAGTLSGTEFGIEIRAGELTIEKTASITASGNFSDPVPNGNGSTVTGAAVAVSQHTTNLPIIVKILGGTISATGNNGHAFYEIDTVNGAAEDIAKGVSISVEGGNFSGNVYSTNHKVTITGGIFSTDVSEYVDDSLDLISNGDGTYSVGEITSENAVAQIGENYYGTLTQAWNAALSAGTADITLLKDVSGQGVLNLDNISAKISISLNGHDIGFAEGGCFQMQRGSLTLNGTGEVYEEVPYYGPVKIFGNSNADTANACVFTVNEGVTLRGWSAIFINGYKYTSSEFYANGVVVNVNGATLESIPDTGNAGGHAIYVQGNIKVPGTYPLKINLNQATLKATSGTDGDGNGMYLAGYAETVITDSTITAGNDGTGIEIRAGKLTINGNTNVTGGSGEVMLYKNGNGLTTDNVALSVAQHTTGLDVDVTINGGTFTGSAAFVEHNPQGNSDETIQKVALNIDGGQFTSTQSGQPAVYSQDKTGFISDGTFSTGVAKYVETGKYSVGGADGMFTVQEQRTDIKDDEGNYYVSEDAAKAGSVASITRAGVTTYFASFEAAMEKLQSGDTLNLWKDVRLAPQGDGDDFINLPSNVTLNGHGKTITADTSNWSGVDRHVIGIDNAANVTVQNLKIVGDYTEDAVDPKVKAGIHAFNSTDVTIENVEITNCGTVGLQINGSTVTATGLDVSESGWGCSVNVDDGNATTLPEFTFNGGTLSDDVQIYTELTDATDVIKVADSTGLEKVTGVGDGLKGYIYYTDDPAKLGEATVTDSNGTTVYEDLDEALAAATGDGDTVTVVKDAELGSDFTIPGSLTLVVEKDVTLTIPDDKTLTNKGTIYNHGTIDGTVNDESELMYTEITFVTTPANATVTVDGVVYPNKTASLENGPHNYTVSASGYYTATGSFTVSGSAQTISVVLTPISSGNGGSSGGSSEPSYSPVIDITGNGDVKVSPRTPSEGDEVTITPDPDNGYEVDSVTVTDRSGRTVRVTENRDGTYTFTQPAGRVTIEVTFVRTGENTFFTDVPETFWAYDEISWAYENGYVNGVTDTTFNPNGAISRQQVWMILARLSGYNPADMAAARAWAMENGVSDGTNPGNAVTRQQLVALLFRFAELRNHANDQRADLSVYPDAGTVAEYAVEPMQWSVANDIVGGTTAGTLNPEGTATRAQFAVILYRFWTNV